MAESRDAEPNPMAIDANTLRRLAEAADGQRGVLLALSLDAALPDGTRGLGLVPISENRPPAPGEILVQTPQKQPKKLLPKKVTLVHPVTGKDIDIPVDVYDAVFWGEAAAEKFLVPYYIRFLSDAEMQRLRDAIADEAVIAIAHVYPTFFDTVTDQINPGAR